MERTREAQGARQLGMRRAGRQPHTPSRRMGIRHQVDSVPHALFAFLGRRFLGGFAKDRRARMLGGPGRGRRRHQPPVALLLGLQQAPSAPCVLRLRLVPPQRHDSGKLGGKARVAQDRHHQLRRVAFREFASRRKRVQLLRHVQVRRHRSCQAGRGGRCAGAGEQRPPLQARKLRLVQQMGRHPARHRAGGDAADIHRRRMGSRPLRREGGRG